MLINIKHSIEYQLRNTREGKSESLTLKRMPTGGESLKEVLAAVRGHAPATEVKQLNVHNAGISDADCPTLCELMACLPNLVAIEISKNPITEAGLETLTHAFTQLPKLRSLSVEENAINDEGLARFSGSLRYLRGLSRLSLKGNPISDRGLEGLVRALVDGHHPNICHVDGVSDDALLELCAANKEKGDELSAALCNQPLDTLSVATLFDIGEHHNALRYSSKTINYKPPFERLEAYLATLPTVQPDAILSPDELTAASGVPPSAPLENPTLWADFPALCRALAQRGSPLTVEHLQNMTTRDGESFWDLATRHAPANALVAGLNASGIRLQAKQLLDEKGEPNSLFCRFIERGVAYALMTPENCAGAPVAAVKKLMAHMPPAQQVENPHQFFAALRISGAQAQMQR